MLEAKKVMAAIAAKFKSFDANKDGHLDKKEIIAYAKKDCEFLVVENCVVVHWFILFIYFCVWGEAKREG